jgi:hypothetical protein
MTVTLQDAVKIADEWTPGCGRWDAFENMPVAPKQLRWCWHGAKLLAIAQDSGNPDRVARERASLINAIDGWCEAGKPEACDVEPEPIQPAVAPQGPSLGVCVAALAGGYAVGRMLRGGHGHAGSHLARAVTNAAVYSVVRPAFASLIKGR